MENKLRIILLKGIEGFIFNLSFDDQNKISGAIEALSNKKFDSIYIKQLRRNIKELKVKKYSMKTITIKGLKFVTFEEVLKKQMKIKGFKEGYEKEVARLNMIHQLKQARLSKKMTQEKLAQKTGMPQSVIARLESGRQGLSFVTISKIATALDKKIQLV